jgi:peroxiredoxin
MNGKKVFLLFLIVISVACARHKKFVVAGRIDHVSAGETAYLQELRVFGERTIDSAKVKRNGKFRLAVTADQPGFYQLVFSTGPSLALVLSPHEKLSITADMNNFYRTKTLEGSVNSQRLNVLHDSLRSTIMQLNAIRTAYNKTDSTGKTGPAERKALEQKYIDIRQKYHRYSAGYILEDLHSLTNIGALYQEYGEGDYVFSNARDLQFFKLVSDTLSKYYPEVRNVKALKQNYTTMFGEYQTRKLMQSTPHTTYDIPDLSLPGRLGADIPLSSLKGKIVLISFWNVSQQESIDNMLALKKIYTKFGNKGFEIYQVAFDTSLPHWRQAIAFDEIPWVSVVDTSTKLSKTQNLYNVHSLPMNYLIDKDQKEILAKDIQPDALENSLPYLLNKK